MVDDLYIILIIITVITFIVMIITNLYSVIIAYYEYPCDVFKYGFELLTVQWLYKTRWNKLKDFLWLLIEC